MQGSKSRIADKIIDLLPSATHFYDLFGGGCALSHAALLSGKFQHVHANDITDSVVLFKDAIAAYELGYEYVGIEIDKEYYEKAKARLLERMRHKSLFEDISKI